MKFSFTVNGITHSCEFQDSPRFETVLGQVDRVMRVFWPDNMRNKSVQLSRDTSGRGGQSLNGAIETHTNSNPNSAVQISTQADIDSRYRYGMTPLVPQAYNNVQPPTTSPSSPPLTATWQVFDEVGNGAINAALSEF